MSQLRRNLQRFKLITFDVTDTLMKFSKPPAIQYLETAKSLGLTNISQDKVAPSFRKNFKLLAKEHPNYGYNSIECHDWWRQLVMRTLNDASTAKLDEVILNNVAVTLIKQYQTQLCWTKFDKVDELLIKLKEEDKQIGIISNFDSRLSDLLKNMKVPCIDFVLTSYEAGHMKPQREIFDLALTKCRDWVLPYEALHIGNEIELDCKGAMDAEWSGVLIRNKEKDEENESKVKCPTFDTISDFLVDLETKPLHI